MESDGGRCQAGMVARPGIAGALAVGEGRSPDPRHGRATAAEAVLTGNRHAATSSAGGLTREESKATRLPQFFSASPRTPMLGVPDWVRTLTNSSSVTPPARSGPHTQEDQPWCGSPRRRFHDRRRHRGASTLVRVSTSSLPRPSPSPRSINLGAVFSACKSSTSFTGSGSSSTVRTTSTKTASQSRALGHGLTVNRHRRQTLTL